MSLEQLNVLQQRRSNLLNRKAAAEYAINNAQREMDSLKKEMELYGVSPETIESEIERLEKEQDTQLKNMQEELDKFENSLIEIEKVL